jgi:hypothetical protein
MSSEHWLTELSGSAQLRPGLSEDTIKRAEEKLGISFPAEYRELLLFSDGLHGTVGRSHLQIYPLQGALETNDRFKEFRDGLFVFGSDGGAEAYVFDTDNKNTILMTTFVSLGRGDAVLIAETFPEFLKKLASGKHLEALGGKSGTA